MQGENLKLIPVFVWGYGEKSQNFQLSQLASRSLARHFCTSSGYKFPNQI